MDQLSRRHTGRRLALNCGVIDARGPPTSSRLTWPFFTSPLPTSAGCPRDLYSAVLCGPVHNRSPLQRDRYWISYHFLQPPCHRIHLDLFLSVPGSLAQHAPNTMLFMIEFLWFAACSKYWSFRHWTCIFSNFAVQPVLLAKTATLVTCST